MHLWIDIDNYQFIPFLKELINELKERGHDITLTALNSPSIKDTLKNNSLEAKVIGNIFSFFGLFQRESALFRSALLANYIKERNVDTAFSLGSESMMYTCSNESIPTILLMDFFNQKPHPFYFLLENCTYLIPENISDKEMIEKRINLQRVAKFKGNIHIEGKNHDLVIKELVNKIEYLSKVIPGKLIA